jgi:hypothetical protein
VPPETVEVKVTVWPTLGAAGEEVKSAANAALTVTGVVPELAEWAASGE